MEKISPLFISISIFSFIFSFIISLLFHLVSSFLFHLLSLFFILSRSSLLFSSLAFLSCLRLLHSCLVSLSLSSFSVSLRVLLLWRLLCLVCMSLRCGTLKTPVCTGTTHACGNACGRGAGAHGDVLDVHMGRGRFERTHGERGGGGEKGGGGQHTPTHTRQHPHIAHQQHTRRTTHKRTTRNTEHARCHRQFCLPKFAHVGLSLDPNGSPMKPLDLTHFQFEN